MDIPISHVSPAIGAGANRRRLTKAFLAFTLVVASVALAAGPVSALTEDPGEIALNEAFISWYDAADVVHIFYGFEPDDGGESPIEVNAGTTVLFGFEWGNFDSVEDADAFIADEGNDITVSVDGGPAVSVKNGYQDAFDAEPGVGPVWSWDHDNDGDGDGNDNGVGDWDGPVVFFRYESGALGAGSHTFAFEATDNSSELFIAQTVDIEAVDACDEFEGQPCASDPCVAGCTIVVDDDANGALAEFTCAGCTAPVVVTTLGLVDNDVAAFQVLTGANKGVPYTLVVTMDKGQGPAPGKASVLVIPDDGSPSFVLPKCTGSNPSACVTIKRISDARTQYTVNLTFDPGIRFR